MNGIVLKESATSSRVDHAGGCVDYQDPLDPDGPTDAPLTTSRRGLARLALVATEVGARFQREGVGHGPMAWMLASRRLFGGEAALDACLEREACLRAVLLHGLSLGLDAGPDQIGALLGDTPGDVGGGFWEGGDGAGAEPTRQAARRQRLFSTMIVFARGGELVHVFHASVAPSAPGPFRCRCRFSSRHTDRRRPELPGDQRDAAARLPHDARAGTPRPLGGLERPRRDGGAPHPVLTRTRAPLGAGQGP